MTGAGDRGDFGPPGNRADGLRATLDLVLDSVRSSDDQCQRREAAVALRLALGATMRTQLAEFLKMLSAKKRNS